jgi:hypothetical protein
MKKMFFIYSIIILALTSCAIGPTSGILFTNNSFAGEFNPSNKVKSIKTGEGCQWSVLGLVSYGNAGAGKIAYEYKIERIATIDHSTLNILVGLFQNYCTIVTGE